MMSLQNFIACKDGSIAITGAFASALLVPLIAGAIDYSSISTERNAMQRSLDAAILAATSLPDLAAADKDGTLQARGEAFLRRTTMSGDLRGSDTMSVTFTYDAGPDRVHGSVSYKPKTIFVGDVLNLDRVTITATASPAAPVNVEIALALDVSSSMKFSLTSDEEAVIGSRRIDALIDGVDALVESLDQQADADARIAVIPYSSSVDIFDLYEPSGSKAGNFKGARGETLNSLGLETAILDDDDYDDDDDDYEGKGKAKGKKRYKIKNSSGKSRVKGVWAGERADRSGADSFILSTAAPSQGGKKVPVISQRVIEEWCDNSYIASHGSKCIDVVKIGDSYWLDENYFAPREGLLPLSEPSKALPYVKTLVPEGGTAGHLGTEWALYALTPEWDALFKHKDGPPEDFDSPTEKVLVIMTDGEFTMSIEDHVADTEIYAYFQDACSKARDLGVTIYAIGLRSSSVTDQELSKCAGPEGKYYSAGNRSELVEAFENIAEAAVKMRVTG